MKFLNMLLCSTIFLTLSVWARKLTVSTQMTAVELWKVITTYRTTMQAHEGMDDEVVEEEESDDSIKDTVALFSASRYNETLEETIEVTPSTILRSGGNNKRESKDNAV
jgi:hypothetical protein